MPNSLSSPAEEAAPPRTGFRHVFLTPEQAAALSDWLADTSRVVVVGSVHAVQLATGNPADFGRYLMRVGTVSRDRIPALRRAAQTTPKQRRKRQKTATRPRGRAKEAK